MGKGCAPFLIMIYTFISLFILIPILVYQLVNPPCQKDIIQTLPCDANLSQIQSDQPIFLQGCNFKTQTQAKWTCDRIPVSGSKYKSCKLDTKRSLLSNRNLRPGAGGGGINPNSKKKKKIYIVDMYKRTSIQLYNSTISNIVLPKQITNTISNIPYVKNRLPSNYNGCCEKLENTITKKNTVSNIQISILASYDNKTETFIVKDNDSCFNVRIGHRYLWQVNSFNSTEPLILASLIPLPFILTLLLIICCLFTKEFFITLTNCFSTFPSKLCCNFFSKSAFGKAEPKLNTDIDKKQKVLQLGKLTYV